MCCLQFYFNLHAAFVALAFVVAAPFVAASFVVVHAVAACGVVAALLHRYFAV
ncbi:hypothetical protein [Mucilaginibacter sp.]|uniref:hypothetical protein n=1 Tax=Mucilaginibacter sp. TaxID=1882438 RepID=UPI00283F0F6D|nr:hypothetical protein [Mucilaginibacter sp.]MDR3696758.1 hypothetical protein [Mucilaginibacter sp.]